MFGKMQAMMQQLQAMQRLMQDERFKTVLAHPKVQTLLQDLEFQALVKARDMAKITTHPKFAVLMNDPEFVQLIATLAPETQAQDAA